MSLIIAVCGLVTFLGIPWAVLLLAFSLSLKADAVPSRKFVLLVGIALLPTCIFLVPIFLEIGLLRVLKRIDSYQCDGKSAFVSDKRWATFGFFRKYRLMSEMLIIVALLGGLLVPLSTTRTSLVSLPFTVQYAQDSSLELGDTQTRQPGTNGQGLKRQSVIKPVFAYLTGATVYYKNAELPTQTTLAPVNQIVAQGTKKYQYMWCSNGAYRYYTNDQFKSASVGFTHKSPDFCAQNKEGHMTGLADTAPPQQTTRTVYTPSYTPSYLSTPTYTTCHDYSFMNEFSCTSY